VQLTLSLGDDPGGGGEVATGLPEMTTDERVRAELEILGLDVTQHVVTPYAELLGALGVTRSKDLLNRRSRSELLVAGVKVATQTPPIRSGRRVIFLTLDDSTGPIDCTFFEDAQGPYAATVFHSWLMVVRGELRRTGRRGVSVRATGAWELSALHALWRRARTRDDALAAVRAELARLPDGHTRADEPGRRRVLVHSSGFQLSPYADIKPAGESAAPDGGRGRTPIPPSAPSPTGDVARKLWHRSPGSPG
jgi:error-prone DNA polymerase